ncbi:hypothetical protein ACFQX7_22490 [Luedemannella flava]
MSGERQGPRATNREIRTPGALGAAYPSRTLPTRRPSIVTWVSSAGRPAGAVASCPADGSQSPSARSVVRGAMATRRCRPRGLGTPRTTEPPGRAVATSVRTASAQLSGVPPSTDASRSTPSSAITASYSPASCAGRHSGP